MAGDAGKAGRVVGDVGRVEGDTAKVGKVASDAAKGWTRCPEKAPPRIGPAGEHSGTRDLHSVDGVEAPYFSLNGIPKKKVSVVRVRVVSIRDHQIWN